MASQRRNRTQADADKTMRTRLVNKIKEAGAIQAAALPRPYCRFLRQLELEGVIQYTPDGWVMKFPKSVPV